MKLQNNADLTSCLRVTRNSPPPKHFQRYMFGLKGTYREYESNTEETKMPMLQSINKIPGKKHDDFVESKPTPPKT